MNGFGEWEAPRSRRHVNCLIEQVKPVIERVVRRALVRYQIPGGRRAVGQEVDDLVQDVLEHLFVQDIPAISLYDPNRGDLPQWVGRVARNLVASILRSKRRNPWTLVPVDDAFLEISGGYAVDASECFDQVEAIEDLLRNEGARTTLLFRAMIEGQDAAETAARTATSVAAIYSARARLRKRFEGPRNDETKFENNAMVASDSYRDLRIGY